MLGQRILTALVLLAVLLPALFYPSPWPFCALTLVLIVAGGWEWARLCGLRFPAALACGLGLGAALALLWWGVGLETPMPGLWLAASLSWAVLLWFSLRRGVSAWGGMPGALRLWPGLLLIGLAWWAMAQARAQGVELLLSMMSLVWVADISAYFAGKAFGRRKLAPTISPGKSWEGVVGGALGVACLAVGWIWIGLAQGHAQASLYGRLWAHGPLIAALALVGLTAASVAGDLFESLVKRSAGVKDSSGLLPGHGGVLDRVDALLPVLPLAMMLSQW
jgi:phosphatidate cytidylyltransferase